MEQQGVQVSERKWLIAMLLAFFLGAFGVHRFYLGYNTTGIAMVVITLVGFVTLIPLFITGLWALIDFIRIIIGSMKDSNGLALDKS
jgi:TM2 domain-containing membrane protein YozV